MIFAKKFLKENPFDGNDAVYEWLCEIFTNKILTGSALPLETVSTDELKAKIQKGDLFYYNAFRANGFVTDVNKDDESTRPFYEAINNIYSKIILNGNAEPEKLPIYTELRKSLEEILGEKIAERDKLQQYELWMKIHNELHHEFDLHHSWINTIPITSIDKEMHKFSVIPHRTKLSDITYMRGYNKDNEEQAANYIAYIDTLKSKTTVEYLKDACRSSDLLTFKESVYLQEELIKRTGFTNWLRFVDSLVYPTIQNHIFLLIHELDEYIKIFESVSSAASLHTPKEHLFVIALENYFDFLDRNTSDLSNLISRQGNTEAVSTAIQNVKAEFELWQKDYIPESFQKILAIIFPGRELKTNSFLFTFFDWINSHTTLYYTHPITKSKINLIDSLNEIFLNRLQQNETDVYFLIDNLKAESINFEALKKVVSVMVDLKPDSAFINKLFDLYVGFIRSDKFSWSAEGDVNFENAINNTYYFSQVIANCANGFQKWYALFTLYKINHDGWLKNSSDYKDYQRESFLFCAGIGMTYNLYTNKNIPEARKIFAEIFGILIRQIRNSSGVNSIDYLTPVKFASITIGSFDQGNAENYLEQIILKCDKLNYVLIALNVLAEYDNSVSLSKKIKALIKQRIDEEFWIIEKKKSEVIYKNQLEYFQRLKTKAIEICQ